MWKVTQPSGQRGKLGFDARDRVTTMGFYAARMLSATVNCAPDENGNILTVTEGAAVLTRG